MLYGISVNTHACDFGKWNFFNFPLFPISFYNSVIYQNYTSAQVNNHHKDSYYVLAPMADDRSATWALAIAVQ